MPKAKNKLSPRHREVVDYYFGASNFNKTDAIRRAGYAHPNKNNAIFNVPAVVAEVERRHELVRERYEVNYDRVVGELARIAFSSPLDFWEVDEDGKATIDLMNADADSLRAVGELKVRTYTEGRGEDARVVTETTLKPWNKNAALDSLMRHAGLSREKSPLEGAGGLFSRILDARILDARRRVSSG